MMQFMMRWQFVWLALLNNWPKRLLSVWVGPFQPFPLHTNTTANWPLAWWPRCPIHIAASRTWDDCRETHFCHVFDMPSTHCWQWPMWHGHLDLRSQNMRAMHPRDSAIMCAPHRQCLPDLVLALMPLVSTYFECLSPDANIALEFLGFSFYLFSCLLFFFFFRVLLDDNTHDGNSVKSVVYRIDALKANVTEWQCGAVAN